MTISPSTKSYRLYFSLLFLIFGVIIALLTSIVNYNLDVRNIKTELSNKAGSELVRKRSELTSFTTRLERYVSSLRNNSALHTYILEPNEINRNIVNQLFYTISSTDPSLMQVRFIDAHGMEKIRIDWDIGKQWPDIIGKNDLQNKAQRYYFIEASQIPVNSFWYSKLDLNVEHKKIEIPYKPVLRIASPVYVEQQFEGVVIINIHARGFLQKFKESPFFNVALVDHEGHYLLHYQDEFSWSRYLQTEHTLTDDYPDNVYTILHASSEDGLISLPSLYAAPLAPLLEKDRAHLLLFPKKQTVQGMKSERRKAMFLIIGTILLFTIPLAILISRIPARLNQKISKQNIILQEYIELIDHNILTTTIDTKGLFAEISTAFCRASAFSKKELIGKNFAVIQHPDMAEDVKENLLDTIKNGKTWHGEMHNRTKNGASYWTETTVLPNFDEQKNGSGYTFILQDITDKKHIEKLSITDPLTGLYNRRSFNETLEQELRRTMRDNKMLCFAMLDIDFFKQYNDHYGHQKGDEVLMAIGQTLQQTLSRSSDFCFRLGGEEFGIVFSDLSTEQAQVFTEKVRAALEGLAIEHRWGCAVDVVTASFGLLLITPAPGITVDTIYKKADQALYSAKKQGRNRIFSDHHKHPE